MLYQSKVLKKEKYKFHLSTNTLLSESGEMAGEAFILQTSLGGLKSRRNWRLSEVLTHTMEWSGYFVAIRFGRLYPKGWNYRMETLI
jgi:hypothetical protein